MKRQLVLQFLRDVILGCIVLYCALLVINVVLDNFVQAIFPLHIFGWITLISTLTYSGFFLKKSSKNY